MSVNKHVLHSSLFINVFCSLRNLGTEDKYYLFVDYGCEEDKFFGSAHSITRLLHWTGFKYLTSASPKFVWTGRLLFWTRAASTGIWILQEWLAAWSASPIRWIQQVIELECSCQNSPWHSTSIRVSETMFFFFFCLFVKPDFFFVSVVDKIIYAIWSINYF